VGREDIVREARAWRIPTPTPFIHQAHTKGIGADCVGYVGGVALNCRRVASDLWQRAAPYLGYARSPHKGLLEKACDEFMERIDRPEIGDVIGLRFDADTQHLAILTDYPGGLGMIHALAKAGKVVEHRYASVWVARTTHAWRMGPVNG
jgi:hypothetical protein